MNRNTTTALTVLSAAALNAHAGLAGYTDRTAFDAATGAQTIETFESESLGQFAMPTIFDSGLGADVVSGNVSSLIEAGDPSGYGFENTTAAGRKYLRMGQFGPAGPETGSYSVEFTFGGSVEAFGFDISGFQPNLGAGGFNISLFSNGQLVQDFFVPSDQSVSEARFYGWTLDGGFDAARVFIPVLNTDANDADFVAFDDVTWSNVPTPASGALLALGGLVASRRRRA